jgi:hypothetical protein
MRVALHSFERNMEIVRSDNSRDRFSLMVADLNIG